MEKLIRMIETIRSKLDDLRKRSLKEMPTRSIIVDPLLEALGWDVRDPDEVELEYPTVDGKSVDYALLLNRKPALLVEAKSLDDPLNDVKAITQVVGYAANDGIVWCVLTNGAVWKVYRSIEECPAPEKLMFEVSLDPHDSEGLSVEQIARQMWSLSCEEIAKGTLDARGERTFNDSKVRKALDDIMRNPPRTLLNLVRAAIHDGQLTPQRIKESLPRIWAENTNTMIPAAAKTANPPSVSDHGSLARNQGSGKVLATRRVKATRTWTPYDESSHTSGKPKEIVELYRAIDRLCFSLQPGQIERHCVKVVINYVCNKRIFCCVMLQKRDIHVYLKLKYGQLESPPSFARDVTAVGHFGVGNLRLALDNIAQLNEAAPLIRKSLEGQLAQIC